MMVSSDARNKEAALARIKRLANSGLPLEPFVRALFELINDAVPNSPNRTFHIGGLRNDNYICNTPEVSRIVPLHERYFVGATPEISGARYRIDVSTMRRLSTVKPIWQHEEVALPHFRRSAGYNEVFKPIGYDHCLMTFFQESGEFLGCYPIWRMLDQRAFSAEDLAFLHAAVGQIAHGLKSAQLLARGAHQPAGAGDFTPVAGWEPGMVLIDQAGHPIALDAQARLIFQQVGMLDGISANAFRLPQLRDAFDYIARTLREIFHDPDSGLSAAGPPVARVYAHWSRIVLKLRGCRMTGADGREYTTVIVERGETAEARRRRMIARWGLSPREGEVLDLIVGSKTGPEIAIMLGLSHDTVRKHTSSILAKLGAETRAAAVSVVRAFV